MSKKRAKHSNGEAIFRKKHRADDQFENLPKDILCLILSRLTLKEVVRISTLSSKWRQAGASYPKLKFDGTAMCGSSVCDKQQYTQKFIENVNAVLRWHDGMAIEDFEVKFPFHKMLVDHLKNWVSFAASSKVKNLVIDMETENFGQCEYRYIFPFALFDKQSISHLERIQLSMVALKLPSQFIGFPNLKVLDLRILHVSANDLQRVLSSCFNLERLSINLCHLHDELRGAAGAVIHYMGYTPGLFIVGLFGILIMWMYGYFWITGMLLVAEGCMCSLKHARFVIPVLTIYADYCVAVRVGWLGVFLTLNLSFLTNDLLNKLLQGYEGSTEERHFEETKDSDPVMDEFYRCCEGLCNDNYKNNITHL